MAAIDPIAYLRAMPPFSSLSDAIFERVAATVEIGYYPARSRLATAGGTPLEHLYVIRRGSVRLERDGQVVQVLEEGELFGYTSLITGTASLDVHVEEDLLAYRIPAATFKELLADAAFASHFATGLAERLKSSLQHSPVATFQPNLAVPVADLIRRPAVWVDPDSTVADAAEIMSRERISSVLVRGTPPGIVTDRDFRSRVLAEGLGPETLVSAVTTTPVCAVDAASPVYDAWTVMLDAGSHHVAVKRGHDIVAVLSSSDLLRVTARGPVAVLRRVERLERGSLRGFSRHVAEMSSALLAAGLDVTVIEGFVARLGDTLLRRIISWAEADLGPPPAPYAWVVFGAEGRMEQTLLSDREHGLVHGDGDAALAAWFRSFADKVDEDLTTAGLPASVSGRSAREWRGSLSEWEARLRDALETHPHDAGVYFDMRQIAGALDLSPLDALLAAAHDRRNLVRMLAKASLSFRPPATLVARVRPTTVDLWRHAILPIALLARCYAVELGARERSTLARLDAARSAGLIGGATAETIRGAFGFLLEMRLRCHLRQIAAGAPLSDEISLSEITPVARNRLKDSLRAISRWQEKSAYRYQIDLV